MKINNCLITQKVLKCVPAEQYKTKIKMSPSYYCSIPLSCMYQM